MIIVRFPTGLAVEYAEANYIQNTTSSWALRSEEGDRLIAIVPFSTGAVMDYGGATRVYNSLEEGKPQ